ncbi:MAG: hypothetical protein WBQ57_04105 [Rhodanobacteraceae bacterium]
MRTTVTLDPDVEILLKQAMREHGLPFKQVLNNALRSSLGKPASTATEPFRQRVFKLGRPRADLTKALSLAGELDDQRTLINQRR